MVDESSLLPLATALTGLALVLVLARRRSSAIPLADAPSLARASRPTALVRTGLVLVAVGLLSLGAALIRSPASPADAVLSEGTRSTVVVLDFSASVSDLVYTEIARTLRAIESWAGESRRVGLVLFSDVAQEALPPGTKARELRPFIRFFVPKRERITRGRPSVFRDAGPGAPPPTQYPLSPWFATFSGGTRISTGLALARQALQREGASSGRVVLISDLADAEDDIPRLTSELVAYGREGIELRVVALPPATERDKEFYRRVVGEQASVVTPAALRTDVRAPRTLSRAAVPLGFALVVVLLGVALAASELGAPLTWRPGRGAR